MIFYCEQIADTAYLDPCVTQRGMALVFSLVVLLILTILGISALRTSSLEQLMAGNIQDLTRALEAADSGLSRSLNDLKAISNPPTYSLPAYQLTGMGTTVTPSSPTFLQTGQAPASITPTSKDILLSYYNQQVVGSTVTNARSVLHQGFISQGAPKDISSPD